MELKKQTFGPLVPGLAVGFFPMLKLLFLFLSVTSGLYLVGNPQFIFSSLFVCE